MQSNSCHRKGTEKGLMISEEKFPVKEMAGFHGGGETLPDCL